MPKVITANTVDRELWDDFVERHPLGTIYHHSLWQDVVKKTYGYQPLYHFTLNNSSGLQAAISSVFVKSWLTGNRIVSYPFSDACDPLVRHYGEFEPLLNALMNSSDKLNALFVELRLARANRFFSNARLQSEYLTHLLPLDKTPEALFGSFHKNSIQRAVKKAKKQDLEVIKGRSKEDLKSFYRLHLMTRKKHGIPIQPYQFFRNLWNSLSPRDMLTLFLVRHRDRWIAGIIILWFKKTAYYKFGASDEAFLQLRANQFLMWEAIRRAQEKGYKEFDFGRTSTANRGLAQYKTRWGAHKSKLNCIRVPAINRSAILSESSRKHALLKRLLTNMPVFVHRVSGELLYRHFG